MVIKSYNNKRKPIVKSQPEKSIIEFKKLNYRLLK